MLKNQALKSNLQKECVYISTFVLHIVSSNIYRYIKREKSKQNLKIKLKGVLT